eukprot:5400843-Prymnesium_polylepis.2
MPCRARAPRRSGCAPASGRGVRARASCGSCPRASGSSRAGGAGRRTRSTPRRRPPAWPPCARAECATCPQTRRASSAGCAAAPPAEPRALPRPARPPVRRSARARLPTAPNSRLSGRGTCPAREGSGRTLSRLLIERQPGPPQMGLGSIGSHPSRPHSLRTRRSYSSRRSAGLVEVEEVGAVGARDGAHALILPPVAVEFECLALECGRLHLQQVDRFAAARSLHVEQLDGKVRCEQRLHLELLL